MVERIAAALAARPKRLLAGPHLTPAAVVVPIIWNSQGVGAVFTRRTQAVETHKGEYAFPGGFAESRDQSLRDTALRELEEELGVNPEDVQILGELDDLQTIHAVRISPFVGIIPHPYPFRPNPVEVAEVVVISLDQLMAPGIRTVENWQREDGFAAAITFYRVGRHVIWGATGKIVDEFLIRLGMLA